MVRPLTLLAFALLLGFSAAAQTVLIPFTSTWQYSDRGELPDTSWAAADYNDAAWKSGPALLGYGIKGVATPISFGPDSANKYITTYFRKAFYLPDTVQLSSFRARIRRDDGVVVYVNGREVYRNNLPDKPIYAHTRAASARDHASLFIPFLIDAAHFKPGRNIVAVEVHQTNPLSSDMAFDLELLGSTAAQFEEVVPPLVESIRRHEPLVKAVSHQQVTFLVTFSKPVTGVNRADFQVTAESGAVQGTLSPTAVRAGTGGRLYEVTVSDLRGAGELRLDLKAGATGIADEAGQELRGGFNRGQSYTVKDLAEQGPVALLRGPYLQMGSQTGVTIRWQTKTATGSRVEVGTRYGQYPLVFRGEGTTREHEVRVSGLQAGTRYYYRLGNESRILQQGPDHYFVTAPPPGDSGKVRIAVLGDCGKRNSSLQQQTLQAYRKHLGQQPAGLLLLLGDNAYPDGTDEDYQQGFFNAYDSTLLRNHMLFPAPGNHDYHTTALSARNAPYYKIFSLPSEGESGGLPSHSEAYYSFDWGNIHFISLDSHGTEGSANQRMSDTLAAQAEWVKKDLAANTKPWVVAYWHHPPYSMGSHNSDTEDQLAEIRENFIRILERYGVDLVLTGHSHNYERSYPLKNHYGLEASFRPEVHTTSLSSGRFDGSENSCPYIRNQDDREKGIVYVVSGSAAQVGRTQPGWPHDALPFSDNTGGMVYLELEQNRLDAKYLRSDGLIHDQFTLMKDVNQSRQVTLAGPGQAQLTASWIGTYRWSTGDTSRTITVDAHSDTTFWVKSGNNCLADTFRVALTGATALRQAVPQPALPAAAIFPTLVDRGQQIRVQAPSLAALQLQVLDISGRCLSTASFMGSTYVDTGSLPPGMYLLVVQGERHRNTRKFIVK